MRFHAIAFTLAIFCLVSCGEEKKSDDTIQQMRSENEALKQEIVRLNTEKNSNRSTEPSRADNKLPNPESSTPTGRLDFLKSYDGKYPHEVKLLDNPALVRRLKALVGNRFSFIKETWAVEIPMEVDAMFFKASACEAHNCGYTNFIIVYDFTTDVLYAGVREEQVVKTYSEDGSKNDEIMYWESDK